MATPRSLADGCASAISFAVQDADAVMQAVESFMSQLGAVESFAFAKTCCVSHPGGLRCVCQAELLTRQDGNYVLEFNKNRFDSVLFSLAFRLLRTYLETGATPEIFRGQLLPRDRNGPALDPAIVPVLVLPPAF